MRALPLRSSWMSPSSRIGGAKRTVWPVLSSLDTSSDSSGSTCGACASGGMRVRQGACGTRQRPREQRTA